jgi:DiGeorge syndrome critical region 6 (DGCR6) protein.
MSNILIFCLRKYQQRVPCELLSGLANALLNDTVFEIVKGLMEIQHVTEKHLFQQRLQLINKHSSKWVDCTAGCIHNGNKVFLMFCVLLISFLMEF